MFTRLLQFLFLLACLSLTAGCVPSLNKRVMVMDFENATGDMQYDKLSKAIPEYIITHMSSYPGIIFIEHQEVNLYLDEVGLQQDASLKGLRGWQALGRQLHIDYLVVGSVSKLGENFIVNARLFSVRGGARCAWQRRPPILSQRRRPVPAGQRYLQRLKTTHYSETPTANYRRQLSLTSELLVSPR